jgi:hypothetical protein
MRQKLGSKSPNGTYASLLPIVEVLEQSGNKAVDGGFMNSQGGWYCRMRRPIDFELVRRRFDLPAHIELHEENDVVFDRSTWCAVEGPRAKRPA